MSELEDYRQEIQENPQYADIIDSAFGMIKNLDISVNGYTSSSAPSMPEEVTSLPDYELGELLNRQVQWAGYLEAKLSEFSSYYTVLENELEFVIAYLHSELLQNEGTKSSKITERKELVKTDKRYIIVNKEKLKYEVVCNILKANLNATNNLCFNLSRQISLKGQDEQRYHRSNNLGNMQIKQPLPDTLKPKALLNAPIGTPTPKRKIK